MLNKVKRDLRDSRDVPHAPVEDRKRARIVKPLARAVSDAYPPEHEGGTLPSDSEAYSFALAM